LKQLQNQMPSSRQHITMGIRSQVRNIFSVYVHNNLIMQESVDNYLYSNQYHMITDNANKQIVTAVLILTVCRHYHELIDLISSL
jgi:hypothetical protein